MAKEKIASIKSNPSWENGLQNQFQVIICMITLICLFFFFQLHFCSSHLIKLGSTPHSHKDHQNTRNRQSLTIGTIYN